MRILPLIPELISPLAQASDYYSDYVPMDDTFGFSLGAMAFLLFAGLAVSVLFGFWGKSRAEEHSVHPWVGFAAGFFMGWIGVMIVPLLRTDRIVNRRQPPLAHYPPPGAPPHYGQWQPPPTGTAVNHAAEQTRAHVQAAPITPDADGYAACPACGGRVKAGRRSCMSCGSTLA